ncbi:hypothetical protein HPB47_024204 [Ixodes persulcatus]|uniref:Uncharacterized protein n=1 Tax=Ixodes persulcatus TaxID=34615 RepID=A0AC60Q5H8_IXOPE|nr:hypothetical protein HPB47_024204 [Ixodes persulcatus]
MNQPLSRGKMTVALYLRQTDKMGRMRFRSMQGSSPQSPSCPSVRDPKPRMEGIFHEKQEGSLCAQHCLNVLLQGEYFTPVDLAALARQIDEQERQTMAEGGVNSDDYRLFMHQPSGNLDDSGYFSVQVIASALKVWGLDIVPYSSSDPVAQAAQADPTQQQAYICNYKDHWFTVRKLGGHWFNLNSLLPGPEPISSTYLALFLVQLQQEGVVVTSE